MMKTGMLVVVLVALWTSLATAQETEQRVIEMVVGDTKSVPTADAEDFVRTGKGVVGIELNTRKTRFVLSARSEGTATLTLLKTKSGTDIQYTINVRPRIASGSVGARDNVRLDFYFVQLTNRDSMQLGIAWPGALGGSAGFNYNLPLAPPSAESSGSLTVAASVLPRLDFAHAAGWVRILRRASIIVANGENGSFSSGGEINLRVSSGISTSIKTINFGSEVQVQPNYDRRSGRLEVQISADVSEIEDGEEAPGRTISKLETVVNLKLGQSIMLAGLRAERSGRTRVGLPWLSQIPIIGVLFGTHGSSSEEIENLLFIVPSVLESVSLEKQNRVRDALRAYRDFSGAWPDVKLLGPAPGEQKR